MSIRFLIVCASNVVLGAFLLSCAWLCDDAFITYRTVDNLANGYGLTWNTEERVQSFTHPLWLFVVTAAYLITNEIYYTSILLSWVLSCFSVVILTWRIAPSWRAAVLGVSLLASSKAFVDYSSSGLENPLTHLLLVLFIWLLPTEFPSLRSVFITALVAGLATLNRMDTLLLFLPTLLWIFWLRHDRRGLALTVIGFSPFVAWKLFSLYYYGFLFPNTAYAKLGTGIPTSELVVQGIYYVANSLRSDPITIVTLASTLAILVWKRLWHLMPLASGAVLYLLYTILIGGDFMSGRFFSAPFFLAVVLLVRSNILDGLSNWTGAMIATVGLAIAAPYSHFPGGREYGKERDDIIDAHSIADERAVYYQSTGLLNALYDPHNAPFPKAGWADWGRELRHKLPTEGIAAVVTWPHIGQFGFYAGPQCHFVDSFGLADPLTARLPMRRDQPWRIGHFRRVLPKGYTETYVYGRNLIKDQDLARYYEALKRVVSGNLFSLERFKEIYRFNTGFYDSLINAEAYTLPDPETSRYTHRLTMEVPIYFIPEDFGHDLGLGSLYYERQQYPRAIRHLRKALKFSREYVQRTYPYDHDKRWRELHIILSRSLTAMGENRLARLTLETYLQIHPDDDVVSHELAMLPPKR